jgi:hypothetical protein
MTFTRALWIVAGVLGGVLSYVVCVGIFAGYPQYYTNVLSIIGVAVLALTGGVAWIIDERRFDADD